MLLFSPGNCDIQDMECIIYVSLNQLIYFNVEDCGCLGYDPV